MKYRLCKYSSPGWIKDFQSERECREELVKHICSECLSGERSYIGANGAIITEPTEPVDVTCIGSLLSTACGCEFGTEEVWEEYA